MLYDSDDMRLGDIEDIILYIQAREMYIVTYIWKKLIFDSII